MGSNPRSYGYRFNWGDLLTPAIKILLIANTAVFLVQTLVQLILGPQAHRWLIEWFGLMPRGVTHGLRGWHPIPYFFLPEGLFPHSHQIHCLCQLCWWHKKNHGRNGLYGSY